MNVNHLYECKFFVPFMTCKYCLVATVGVCYSTANRDHGGSILTLGTTHYRGLVCQKELYPLMLGLADLCIGSLTL